LAQPVAQLGGDLVRRDLPDRLHKPGAEGLVVVAPIRRRTVPGRRERPIGLSRTEGLAAAPEQLRPPGAGPELAELVTVQDLLRDVHAQQSGVRRRYAADRT